MGVPACDNRFAFELGTGRLQVLNPAFTIKSLSPTFSGKEIIPKADRLKGEVIPVFVTNKLKYDHANSTR
jgi:hypothetical protein